MITLKSAHEIDLMRRAGKITAAARALAREMVKPGVTTHQIDKAVFDFSGSPRRASVPEMPVCSSRYAGTDPRGDGELI